ncbi:MAG: phosphatidylglycerol lysyltransferase domain-containing protein, partial [Candidatus Margulisbacteria bacterium]|nr:phosphatidylglycerol lysyltransferase domain-containing protein [Candidatus Margulisiibacteriota bacterium]
MYGEKTVIPKFPTFKPLEIGDRAEIAEHLKPTPRDICELCAGNLFIWQDFDRPRVTLINNNACVLIDPPNEPPYFLEPFGALKLKETVDTCLKQTGRISRASEMFVALLPPDLYKTSPLRNHFDYIYQTRDLAELKGKKYDGKRNHIKRFTARYPNYEYVPLTPAFKAEAMALFEKWFAVREESRFFPRLAHTAQKGAIETAFKYFNELNLFGGALLIDKKLKGFTLGSAIREDLISVHFM